MVCINLTFFLFCFNFGKSISIFYYSNIFNLHILCLTVVCSMQCAAGSLKHLWAHQRRSWCPTQGLDLISDLLVSLSLRWRWPACQGDAGNVFPPIMCVFNTSGAKSCRRFVKWKSALNLTGGHALISLLHRRMEGEMKRWRDDTREFTVQHEEIVQINKTDHK